MEKEKKEPYRTVKQGGMGEIEEKKSRFIATVRPVETKEQAEAFIEEVKKKYWDARHNCSAFVIGSRGELTRCSDDGEPSGTAGKPILEVLLGEGLRNTAVVVTRYFGGVLLGTGGLVRAYTKAVKEGLRNSTIVTMCYKTALEIRTDYERIGKIQYVLKKRGMQEENIEYTDKVIIRLNVPVTELCAVKKEVEEAAEGRVVFEELESQYYVDKK